MVLVCLNVVSQVDGVRIFLNQNRRTLLSLEFIHCNLPSFFISELFNSLCMNNLCKHNIQYFSIKYSRIFGCNTDVVLRGFSSFLLSARLSSWLPLSSLELPLFEWLIISSLRNNLFFEWHL